MKTVFLDRDGTIVEDKEGYLHEISKLKFLPKAMNGLKILYEAGYALIIITNQSGIARGMYTEQQYQAFKEEMHKRLQEQGIMIKDELFCPHHPEKGVGEYKIDCGCRKPKPGMLEKAITEHSINPKESWTIGDKAADILAGLAANTRTIGIISHEKESGEENLKAAGAEYVCNNLEEAARYILEKDL